MSETHSRIETDRLLERKRRLESRIAADPALAARMRQLRAWQALRLERTYADLRASASSAAVVSFFLSDLYGPQDFSRRDADLSRAWGVLRRTLPRSALEIMILAIELEVLSEELDLAMAQRLRQGPLTAASYAQAFREVGQPEARWRQIGLILDIGERLDRVVRIPLVGVALRAARTPARIMGFGSLQDFIERGFGAFAGMPSAAPLLAAIRERETTFVKALLEEAPGNVSAADGGA